MTNNDLFTFEKIFNYSDISNNIVYKLYIEKLEIQCNIEKDHQIGRFELMKKTFKLIEKKNIKGEILEFGSWRGQGLRYLIFLRNTILNTNKKIFAIDSFGGLPLSEDGWIKGTFQNTTSQTVTNNIKNVQHIIGDISNIHIVEGLFNSDIVKECINNIEKVSFIYFDGDLKTSTLEALNVVKKFFINQKTIYIAFDDWGCMNYTLCAAFGKFFHHLPNFSFKNIGSTALTIFFEITNHNLTESPGCTDGDL